MPAHGAKAEAITEVVILYPLETSKTPNSSRPVVLQTGSPLFCIYLFENVNLHRLIGHQTLEPRVLFFQCS